MKHRFESEVVRFVIANSLKLVWLSCKGWPSFKYANYIIRYRIVTHLKLNLMESLILAQNERWRRGLGMQVERDLIFSILRKRSYQ